MTRILAFVDASIYAASVADHTGWAASALGAAIDVMHVIDRRASRSAGDLAGTLEPDAREHLLAELSALDEQASRLARRVGQGIVDGAAARLKAAGLEAAPRLRTGELVDALAEVESGYDLIVIGKRGEAADFASRHPGSNLERVVRAATLPVLVASRAFQPIDRLVIAFDGGPSASRAAEAMATGGLAGGGPCLLVVAGDADDNLRSRAEAALLRLQAAGRPAELLIRPGEPEEVIGSLVRAGDLLVMGAYGHSPIRTLIVGSTTTAMIRACPVPLLLFR